MLKRVALDIILFISLIALVPWWIAAIFALALSFYFQNYYEIIIAGILLDAFYGTPQNIFFDSTLFFTICSLIIFLAVKILKKKIIYY